MAYTPSLSDLEGLHDAAGSGGDNGYQLSLSDIQDPDEVKRQKIAQMNYITGANRTPLDTLRDLGVGAISGLGKGGQFIASTLTGGRAPTVNFDELLAPLYSQNKSMGGEITKGVGQYLPYGVAGGPSLVGQIMAGLSSGAALTPEGESNFGGLLPSGPTGGALKGALLNALTHGAFKGLEALRPSNIFRGNLSPEELQHNLDVTKGTETGLGSVIENPTLMRMQQNVLPYIPFSGATDAAQRTAKQVQQQGENLLGNLGEPLNTEKQNVILTDALKQASKEATQEKNAGFTQLNKLSDDLGVNIGRDNFKSAAQNVLDEISASPELEREFDPSLLKDIQQYAANDKGNSLKLTNIFKGKLNDKAKQAYIAGNKHEGNVLGSLADALGDDINSGIEASGSQELKDAYVKNQTNYGEKFAPFEDQDILKFTRKGGDPDLLLQHFLRTGGKSDRSYLLSKLMEKLPEDSKNIPMQMYFGKAFENGELNPLSMRTLFKALGENQKKALIPDAGLRKNIEDYIDLVGKNTDEFNTMFNPRTGQRTLDALVKGGVGSLSIPTMGLPIVAGRIGSNLLRSPSLRERLVKEMIENKPKFDTMLKRRGTETLSQGLLNQINRNEDNGS